MAIPVSAITGATEEIEQVLDGMAGGRTSEHWTYSHLTPKEQAQFFFVTIFLSLLYNDKREKFLLSNSKMILSRNTMCKWCECGLAASPVGNLPDPRRLLYLLPYL